MAFKVLNGTPKYDDTGWCPTTGLTNHTILMAYVATLSRSALKFTRTDCHNAVKAMPESRKAGHYTDTAHYCSMELAK